MILFEVRDEPVIVAQHDLDIQWQVEHIYDWFGRQKPFAKDTADRLG